MTLAEILDEAKVLLLDFDGPVCSVFAGLPASGVAEQLRQVLADVSHADIPAGIKSSVDPFEVLWYASTISAQAMHDVNAAFTAHEIEAIASAAPTKGSHELIYSWRSSGRQVAIVSNNSKKSIEAYLHLHNIHNDVAFVAAREPSNVHMLKPNPYLLLEAVEALAVQVKDCVFVGDSLSDIEAARAAGTKSIGYANKPGKVALLGPADGVAESIVELDPV